MRTAPSALRGTTRIHPRTVAALPGALLLALTLAACGGDEEPDDVEPAAATSPAPSEDAGTESPTDADGPGTEAESAGGAEPDAESVTDEAAATGAAEEATLEDEAGPSIRDVDLAELPWREVHTGAEVVPAQGDGFRQLSIGEMVAYADVDGDGHEDALVPLVVMDGNAFEQTWYVWRWDPQAEAPVQVESPVAREAGCGDSVREVTGAEDHFVVTETVRYQDSSTDCAADGELEVTRAVTLQDGWPVLTGGAVGDGGICPQWRYATDAVWPAGFDEMHAAPIEGTSALGSPAPDWWIEVDVSNHVHLWRPNWILVHLGYDSTPPGVSEGYRPCAWLYLEDDDRPIPHAPYREG